MMTSILGLSQEAILDNSLSIKKSKEFVLNMRINP